MLINGHSSPSAVHQTEPPVLECPELDPEVIHDPEDHLFKPTIS